MTSKYIKIVPASDVVNVDKFANNGQVADAKDTYDKLEGIRSDIEDLESSIDDDEGRLSKIESLIPTQAEPTNQLADKNFVNSSIQTYTAYFDGNWDTLEDVPETVEGFIEKGLPEPGPNNYIVISEDEDHDDQTWRYKYTGDFTDKYDKSLWKPEYKVNNKAFTSDEAAALESGATKTKIDQIETNKESIETLSSTIASTDKLGLIRIDDSDFDINDDGILSLYKPITISSLKFKSINSTIYDRNSNIDLDNGFEISSILFEFVLSKKASSIKFDSESITDLSKTSYSITKTYTTKLKTNKSFVLEVVDNKGASKSETRTINFRNRVYYGVSAVTDTSSMDSKFIQGFTNTLASSVARTITLTAGTNDYVYFCCPSAWNPKFVVGGFEGGFSLIKTLSFTNTYSYSTDYKIYRSTNKNLGSVTIVIS